MRLGLNVGYSGSQVFINMPLIQEAERCGFDSVWTAEAYGSDAITPLSWIGAQTTKIKLGTAIMQMPARTPAMTAMTAMTLDQLSGGRFILGLGTSGPQVVEGWHGVPFNKPLAWVREYVAIVRAILAREKPVEFQGERYQIPYRGPDASGLGKPLKSIIHGRKDLPIYVGAMAPKSQAQCAEICDGVHLVFMHPERFDVLEKNFVEGFAKAGNGKGFHNFDVAPTVVAIMGDDIEACRMPVKNMLALYIGGMGARGKNFYNNYACAIGYEEAAKKIQDLYLDGKKSEAIAAVPNDLVDAVALVGPEARIRERFQAWKSIPVGTLVLGAAQPEVVRLLAELAS